jgi:hypothetical protein
MEYTNRELDSKFEQIMIILQRIEDQTTKTNGRVTRLEFWREGLMARVAGIIGTVTVAWIVLKQLLIK